MTGKEHVKYFIRLFRHNNAPEVMQSFHRDVAIENNRRICWMSLAVIGLAVFLLIWLAFDPQQLLSFFPDIFSLTLLVFAGASFLLVSARYIHHNKYKAPVWFMRIPSGVFVFWVMSLGFWFSAEPVFDNLRFALVSTLLFVCATVLVLPLVELMVMIIVSIFGFFIAFTASNNALPLQYGFLGFVLLSAGVSRVLYQRHMMSFINWENISTINETLKKEVYKHMQTSADLHRLTNELDKQVHEKTRHYEMVNEKLQEEIAVRSHADKVRNILYRISNQINKESDLNVLFSYVHRQLEQVMNVSNIMVGIYHEKSNSIDPVYYEDQREKRQVVSVPLSLEGRVLSSKASLLLGHEQIRKFVSNHTVDVSYLNYRSWLGIPLMAEDKPLGVIVLHAYDPDSSYDRTDLQLLEYVAEHLTLAIKRDQDNMKLISAKEKAEASDRLKSAFLANLSHEVRTPMNAIVGFAELIGELDLPRDETQFYCDQLLDNSYRLLDTISNMVELAKVQSDAVEVNNQPFEAKSLASSAFGLLKQLAIQYKREFLKLTLDTSQLPSECIINIDSERFLQVMGCLLGNAVKFTEDGAVGLSVLCNEDKQVVFRISDTGAGIPKEELELVFNSFQKGKVLTNRIQQGTGLGLAIAKSLTEKMRGHIWVESTLGSGSVFSVSFPRIVADNPVIRAVGDRDEAEHYSSASAG